MTVSRESNEALVVRRTVLFSGRVQGVGFRYTTCDIARRFDVAGHVRNLSDGRVEMVAQGTPDEVERFQQAIGAAMRRNIVETQTVDSTPKDEISGFEIRY